MRSKNIIKTWPEAVTFFFILLTCLFSAPSAKVAFGLNGADVAIYNDSRPGKYMYDYGVWPDGVTAIENMLTTLGRGHEKIIDKE